MTWQGVAKLIELRAVYDNVLKFGRRKEKRIGCSRCLNTGFFYIESIYKNGIGSPGSSVDIEIGYGLDGADSIPGRVRYFFLHSFHSRTHRASYPMGTGGDFPGDKVVGV
jgi:hypothetical protein